jgi:hypothetical protein
VESSPAGNGWRRAIADIESYADRQRIKRVIIDAYTPAMRDRFPDRQTEITTPGKHDAWALPRGLLILHIQVTLLRVADQYAYKILFRPLYEQGIALHELARRQCTNHKNITRRIDKMLDDAIEKMTQREAQRILSVYWQMHEGEQMIYDALDAAGLPAEIEKGVKKLWHGRGKR